MVGYIFNSIPAVLISGCWRHRMHEYVNTVAFVVIAYQQWGILSQVSLLSCSLHNIYGSFRVSVPGVLFRSTPLIYNQTYTIQHSLVTCSFLPFTSANWNLQRGNVCVCLPGFLFSIWTLHYSLTPQTNGEIVSLLD